MCGIAGIIGAQMPWHCSALERMTRVQSHRGPDDEGLCWSSAGLTRVGLGHRRLSIQDLSLSGHQPMVHPDTKDILVFNGEIYNAPLLANELRTAGINFQGHSDTEVLLHALRHWGLACVPRLEGMYAFAWLDRLNDVLILARDPLGIKPLFVAKVGGQILFASEVRALLASGRVSTELDQRGLSSLLAYGSTQAPWTLFQSIQVFPAGHWQCIDLNSDGSLGIGEPVRHWRFPATGISLGVEEAAQRVRYQLTRSVRSHLLSDVPVGVFLSSGLDSTLVAGLAAQQGIDVRACTVGFSDAPDQSEAGLAAETAQAFGLPHDVLWLEERDALAAVAPWLDSLDQPSMDGLNTFVISQRIREQGISVALSGQGGDELFGGYPSFADVPRMMRLLRWLNWLPPTLRCSMAGPLSMAQGVVFREKLTDMLRVGGDLVSLGLLRRRCFSDAQIGALLGGAAMETKLSGFIDPAQLEDLPLNKQDIVHAVSLLESRFYLGNTLLPVGDSTGMAHGLEIRVPMLDRPMLDLALGLPSEVRLPDGIANKALLRRAFPELLRPTLLQQSKRGFVIPVRRWMQGALRPLCEAALNNLKQQASFDVATIDAVWKQFLQAPESPIWSRVWLLIVLGWYLKPETVTSYQK